MAGGPRERADKDSARECGDLSGVLGNRPTPAVTTWPAGVEPQERPRSRRTQRPGISRSHRNARTATTRRSRYTTRRHTLGRNYFVCPKCSRAFGQRVRTNSHTPMLSAVRPSAWAQSSCCTGTHTPGCARTCAPSTTRPSTTMPT